MTHPPPSIRVQLQAADGKAIPLQVKCGQSLMRAAVAAGVHGIAADCGGVLSLSLIHI